jgi:hypothetical protein
MQFQLESVSVKPGQKREAEEAVKKFMKRLNGNIIGILAYVDETTFIYFSEIKRAQSFTILTSHWGLNKRAIEEAARKLNRPIKIFEITSPRNRKEPVRILHTRWLSDGTHFLHLDTDLKSTALGRTQHFIRFESAELHKAELETFRSYLENIERGTLEEYLKLPVSVQCISLREVRPAIEKEKLPKPQRVISKPKFKKILSEVAGGEFLVCPPPKAAVVPIIIQKRKRMLGGLLGFFNSSWQFQEKIIDLSQGNVHIKLRNEDKIKYKVLFSPAPSQQQTEPTLFDSKKDAYQWVKQLFLGQGGKEAKELKKKKERLRIVSLGEFLASGHKPRAIIAPVVIREGKILDAETIDLQSEDIIEYTVILRIPPIFAKDPFAESSEVQSPLFTDRGQARDWIDRHFEDLVPQFFVCRCQESQMVSSK